MTVRTDSRWLKAAVVVTRVVIGVIFLVSGLAKLIDLWGTVYKIEDYLTVWQIQQPRTIVFMAALVLSGSEFILGTLTLLGCCRRWAVILLTALMAFMLPLTLYIYVANPVSDCGCFGDMWVISNAATFWKNVAITILLLFLLRFNHLMPPLFTAAAQWLVITLLAAYGLILGLYGYNVQPVIDFRSFPVGASLLPSDDESDDEMSAVEFIYEKDGRREAFTLDALPDSTWSFIEQLEPSGVKPAKTILEVYDSDGSDVTAEAITTEGEELILVIPSLARAEISWTYFLNELSRRLEADGGRMVAFVAADDASVEAWKDLSMASYPVYTAEATTLKELARGNMALVKVCDGHVEWKQSMSLMDTAITDAALAADGSLAALAPVDGPRLFRWLSAMLLLCLGILYILDSTHRLVMWRLRIRRASRKKKPGSRGQGIGKEKAGDDSSAR